MLELKNINLTLRQTDRKLIDSFNFTLHPGDKAVMIGEEGNGKSTLLQFINDRASIEAYCECAGQIIAKGNLGYLPQNPPEELLKQSVGENRLGLREDQRIGTLSGGEKIKLQLERILATRPDILLLDEPTNDIDIEALEWLESFIKSCRQPLLYVSHDETLIERTANTIIHIEQLVRKTKPRITVAHTDYAHYAKTRQLSFDKQMQVARKQRSDHRAQVERWQKIHDRVDHQQKSVSRQDPHGGKMLKRKMKQVKSTKRRLDKESQDFADIPQMEEAILTKFDPSTALPAGKVVLDLQIPQLTAEGRILASNIKLKIMGGEKIGIIGKNGAGKTTLLRKIWQNLKERRDIRAAYMPQDYQELFGSQASNNQASAIDFLAPDAKKENTQQVRTYLGSMKFTKEEMTAPLSKLSGGQRAKVLFLDMVLKSANVLILDEPTRNFSPLSNPVIRNTLSNFGGTIISVSHDRKYLSEVCEKIFELDQDQDLGALPQTPRTF